MSAQGREPIASLLSTHKRKPLGVRVTPEQHTLLTEAARREHRSVSSFVVQAALRAAERTAAEPTRKSPDEIMSIFRSIRAGKPPRDPDKPDLLEAFLTERREAAANE